MNGNTTEHIKIKKNDQKRKIREYAQSGEIFFKNPGAII